jgi:ABC-type transporter Mla subunit MlaD
MSRLPGTPRLRAALAAGLVIAASLLLVLVGTGAGSSGGSYKVRAIFDNASFVIQGEDVKVSGVKVGKIDSLDVTPQKKAAVVLDIQNDAFKDFRQDASCTIRPQSLIGEQFVECTPTRPKAVGAPEPPPLPKIPAGKPGAGQHLLALSTKYGGGTSSPVGIDLIGNTLRLTQREQLSLIINELGTGLAANGQELRRVVRRADPALGQLDRVLAILAKENRTLASLATNSDTVLRPLARDKARVAHFVSSAADVSTATAERRVDLERNIRLLPPFLREIQPTMVRLGQLSDAATPVVGTLGDNAPAINRLIEVTGPFAQASRPAVRSLGKASVIGRPAVIAARPLLVNLNKLATDLRPVANLAAQTLGSFKNSGGVEYALKYIYYQVAAINGFDAFGHYLRAGLLTTDVAQCSFYATVQDPTCSANFGNAASASASAARSRKVSMRQLIAQAKALVDPATARRIRELEAARKKAGGKSAKRAAPSAASAPATTTTAPTATTPAPKAPAPKTTAPAANGHSAQDDTTQGLLDYLVGNGP